MKNTINSVNGANFSVFYLENFQWSPPKLLILLQKENPRINIGSE